MPWQPSPAEAAEGEPLGMARIVSVRREVELARHGFFDDCERCHVAQLGAEATPHSEGCRERIRQAMMRDDVGHAAEQRLAPTGGQQASATRVEVAHKGQDEEMTEVPAASSAKSVSPLA